MRRKNPLALLLGVFVGLVLPACGGAQGAVSYQSPTPDNDGAHVAPSAPAWPNYSRPGFSFDAPPSWEEIPPPQGTLIAVRSTQHAGAFAPNMNVATEPFSGPTGEYAAQNLIALRNAGVTLIRETPLTFQGRSVHDVEGSWALPGVPAYVTLQRYTVDGPTGYVITCAAAVEEFEQYRTTCQQVLDSFNVTGAPTPGAGPAIVEGPNWTLYGPRGWVVIPAPAGTQGAVRSTDMADGFAPNANLATEPWPGTLGDYVTESQRSLQQAGASILRVTNTSLPGRVTQDVESVWNSPGGGTPPYRTVQRFVVHGGTGYVVTCAASHASFEQFRATCDEVLGSFVLR